MPQSTNVEPIRGRILIRLDTLIRLRWWAILGQTIAVLVVAFGFGFPFPWMVCLALIVVSALVNVVLSQRYKTSHRLSGNRVFTLLAFDIAQLGVLIYLTGGLQNPFSILFMAPVVVSATSLNRNHTLFLGLFAFVISTAMVFFYLPLPWRPGESFELPLLFVIGVWVAIVCTLAFTAIYAFRVAEEARKLADALTATELVLQREQHLSTLDGLAAAAAHELGTPLATIALVSKEMVNTSPADTPLREDAELLRSQADRCREILQKLKSLSSDSESIIERQSIAALIEEVVDPLRDFGVAINVASTGAAGSEPETLRNPAVHYGLGNIIDNAVDFAKETVTVETNWTDEDVAICVTDDGSGFSADVLNKLGDPFVTTRSKGRSTHDQGLGLGLFIAKTLLERNGAEVEFSNRNKKSKTLQGASVRVTWPRTLFERRAGLAPAE